MNVIVMNKRLYYTVFLSLLTHISSVWYGEDSVPLQPPPHCLPPLMGEKLLTGKAPILSSFGFRRSPNWQLVEIVRPVNMTIMYGVISESYQTVSVLKCACTCSWLFLSLDLLSSCDASSVSSTAGSAAAARFGTACRTVSILEVQGHQWNQCLHSCN